MSDDISTLIDDLSSSDLERRRAAAEELSLLAAEARPAAVPLVRAAGDADEEVREYAVAALEELGPPDAEEAAALTELLADERLDVGYWAATLLGRLEEDAAGATSELAAATTSSPHLPVRERAAWALGRIGPAAEDSAAALESAAQTDQPRLSRLAKEALAKVRT